MTKKSSPVWLIILLSATIFVLGGLIISSKYSRQIDFLNQEIQRLSQELETNKQLKNQEIKKVKEKPASPSSSLEFTPATRSGTGE